MFNTYENFIFPWRKGKTYLGNIIITNKKDIVTKNIFTNVKCNNQVYFYVISIVLKLDCIQTGMPNGVGFVSCFKKLLLQKKNPYWKCFFLVDDIPQ